MVQVQSSSETAIRQVRPESTGSTFKHSGSHRSLDSLAFQSSRTSRDSSQPSFDEAPVRSFRRHGSSARTSKVVFKTADAELEAQVSARLNWRRGSLGSLASCSKDSTIPIEQWDSKEALTAMEAKVARRRSGVSRLQGAPNLRRSVLIKQASSVPYISYKDAAQDLSIQGDRVSLHSEHSDRGYDSSPDMPKLPQKQPSAFQRTHVPRMSRGFPPPDDATLKPVPEIPVCERVQVPASAKAKRGGLRRKLAAVSGKK